MLINGRRFATGVVDAVFTSWKTRRPAGFTTPGLPAGFWISQAAGASPTPGAVMKSPIVLICARMSRFFDGYPPVAPIGSARRENLCRSGIPSSAAWPPRSRPSVLLSAVSRLQKPVRRILNRLSSKIRCRPLLSLPGPVRKGRDVLRSRGGL